MSLCVWEREHGKKWVSNQKQKEKEKWEEQDQKKNIYTARTVPENKWWEREKQTRKFKQENGIERQVVFLKGIVHQK